MVAFDMSCCEERFVWLKLDNLVEERCGTMVVRLIKEKRCIQSW